ncbi:amino acid adenylation domain-containing protein [Streptomyces sp. NPDC008092]|uniref:amino acid adenylation domain-containing protein n=1 Tax=Streptomyces sp. NPDC008092 TaxID=3364808 RepID=UPI0036E0BDFA
MAADLPDHDTDSPAVAITGLACRFPGADSHEAFWELLRDGAEPHEAVPEEELRRAGLLERVGNDPSYVAVRKPFADPSLFDADYFGMTPAEAAATDPQQRFLLETTVHALQDAALDPGSFRGSVGVFLGMNHSDYLLRHVMSHPEVVEGLGWHRVLMGNDRGFTATGISYRLGLTGPSVAVDCACSSGLAAVHHACRALLDYETDAAVAGGAAIKPTDLGYPYAEGGIGSPDGRCLPFSARAAGTVFASGVGVVVLRRLEDALADGDRVLAVIRASDINNDGARKSSYTAPSVDGQAELVASVHQMAGVAADRVSYVEAHGTATALGDPIEVSALTEAFRETTDARGFCAIGSVKSNIGHTDSASGIAGLIKVVLALRHHELPPTLGCEETSPHIDFASSPFRVIREREKWDGPRPLLAGVSSFGVGGTNVHLLVEEPPAPMPPPAAAPALPARLLPFSAASRSALDARETGLRDRLAEETPEGARDIAYTLTRAHPALPHRRALLWTPGAAPVVLDSDMPPGDPATCAFVFRYAVPDARAVRELIAVHPAFRRTAERLAGPWAAARGTSARRALDDLATAGPAELVGAVLCLGEAAVWAEHRGVAPRAVVTDGAARPAAAVLAGALTEDDLATALAGLVHGVPLTESLRRAAPRPAEIPWYDEDGTELCSAGRLPDLDRILGELPVPPGRRTLPPRVRALVLLGTARALPEGAVPDFFAAAAAVDGSCAARGGHPSLLARLGRAWALGLVEDRARLADADGGRIVDLPPYPFDRRRHWLEAHPPGEAAGPRHAQDAEPGGDGALRQAVDIFAQCLGTDEVGPGDDLFALGGDSLLATRVVAMTWSRLRANVPFGTFLRAPTPQNLARLATETAHADGTTAPQDTTRFRSGVLPLTPQQERFLFLGEIDGAGEAYNVPVLADLRGRLDVPALRAALADVVARHESLRAVFRATADDAIQEILPSVAVELPVVAVADEAALRTAIAELLDRRLPLNRAPVLAARVFTFGADRNVLALSVHHICADAHSTGVLLRDLYACYTRRTTGVSVTLPAIDGLQAAHARSVADWLASPDADRQLRFWLKELADLPEPLELPGDRPPAAARSYRGDLLDFTLPVELSRQVRELAERLGTSPFVVVFAAFAVLLARLGGRPDLVVGVPVSGRHRPETRDLIGNFVNTLAIRAGTGGAPDFRSLVGRLAARVTAGLDHQDLPVEVITRHLGRAGDPQGTPLFQVLFNMLSLDAGGAEPPAGLERRPLPFDRHTSPYELSLDWWFARDGAIAGRFLYDTDRFGREAVGAWQESFAFLLDALTRSPDRPLREVPAEPPTEAARTAATLTGPIVPLPERPVHAVFAGLAAEHPDRLAVTDGRTSLSYGALDRISVGVAELLVARGVRPGENVGVAMARGVPLVAAILGVLRAGATPVPFDLTHPRQRLAVMAQDCGARLVLCTRAADADFADGAAPLELPDPTALRGTGRIAPGDLADPSVGAYLTYTSGTTGRPKGIHFPHHALTNLIHWETAGHTAARRWLQLASFGFDAAFHEMFGALCSGGSLHIADEETKHDHDLLADFVRGHQVQKAILPVSLLHALAARFAADTAAFASLTEIASTGEQLRLSESVVSFFEALPDCRLINNYGPAETHVVTSYRFTGPPHRWPRHAPIGRPIQNVTLAVLDADGQAAPRGAVGELVIGGVCVATGYLGQPELTAERFLDHRADRPVPGGARGYRSGDRARLLPSGDVRFLGRGDKQIKIRGLRVELGEVETVIRKDPDLRDVALTVRGPEGDQRIDAYLVTNAGPGIAERTRERLRAELPAAMVPSSFTVVDRLPVNVNGKVDTAQLPPPAGGPAAAPEPEPHGADGGVLHGVLAVFRRALDNPRLRPDEDFFDAGGHSLLATRVIHAVREQFGVRLSVSEFYEAATPAGIATAVLGRTPTDDAREELPPVAEPLLLPPGLAELVDGTVSAARQKTFVYDTGQRVDIDRLRAAADEVTARHPALDPPYPQRGARGQGPQRIAVHEVPAGKDPAAAAAWLHDEAQRVPVDPRREPLFRLSTAQAPGGTTLLGLTVHLAALDGRGLNTLCRALTEAYDGRSAPREPDDGFLRYVTWRRALVGSEQARQAADTWRSLLPGAPGEPDLLRPVAGGVVGVVAGRASWAPGERLQRQLHARCAEARVTPFLLHLTAFCTALAWSRETDDTVCAVALDGRVAPVLEGSVGAFANVVPMPFRLQRDQPLHRTLAAVRTAFRAVDAVRTVPYADLAAADERLHAFRDLPVVFNYARDDGGELRLGGQRLRDTGPDPLAAGQRVHFTVTDGPASFRAQLKYGAGAAERRDARLPALYRTALYALVFEADTTPEDLKASLDLRQET